MSAARPRRVRSDSVHQRVARNIRNAIEAGVLRHGDVLPSTRELAEQWDTSVFTISEAMKLLAGEGLVISKSRSKRVVNVPEQARRSEIRLVRPQVILIGGHVGSGKSELGRILARETGWPILDKDTLTRPVVESALEQLGLSPHDRESSTYLKVIRPREYEALQAATEENVACRNSAIVTAPFLREFNNVSWLDRTRARIESLDASVLYVWVHCDPETMHTYIRHRGAARDATKLANWSKYLASIDIDFRPAVPHYLIDNSATNRPLQAQAKELLTAILGRGN